MTIRPQEVEVVGVDSDVLEHSGARAARMDLVCSPRVESTAQQLVRQWAREQALPPAAIDQLAALVLAAVGHGLRFGPRGVTILVHWVDHDRLRIDVKWRACSGRALTPRPGVDVESTAATLDALAEAWGFGTSNTDPHQWIVLDTREAR